MKMNKKKVVATIGALGLTAGVLAGCGGQKEQDDDDYVKVVNSEGETVFIEEDDYEEANHNGVGMFILFSAWNGNNHSKLKSSSKYKGKTHSKNPSVSRASKSSTTSNTKKTTTTTDSNNSTTKASSNSGSGIGKSTSGGSKSGGFGG